MKVWNGKNSSGSWEALGVGVWVAVWDPVAELEGVCDGVTDDVDVTDVVDEWLAVEDGDTVAVVVRVADGVSEPDVEAVPDPDGVLEAVDVSDAVLDGDGLPVLVESGDRVVEAVCDGDTVAVAVPL